MSVKGDRYHPDMKVTILGCSGGYPAPGGATSGYLLQYNGKNILIDCGSGVIANLQKYIDFGQIDAIILTHLHADHIADISILKYAIQMNKAMGIEIHAIPLFAPTTPEAAFQSIHDGNLVVGHINASTVLPLFGAEASFFRTSHPVECYGVRLAYQNKVISFSADATYGSALFPLMESADLAIMDCGSLEKYRKPVMLHMTPTECHQLYCECKIKNVVLSHLVPYYNNLDVDAEANPLGDWPYVIAAIGQEYII